MQVVIVEQVFVVCVDYFVLCVQYLGFKFFVRQFVVDELGYFCFVGDILVVMGQVFDGQVLFFVYWYCGIVCIIVGLEVQFVFIFGYGYVQCGLQMLEDRQWLLWLQMIVISMVFFSLWDRCSIVVIVLLEDMLQKMFFLWVSWCMMFLVLFWCMLMIWLM